MDYSKITKTNLWCIFGAVFAVSLYVNYLYFSEYYETKKIADNIQKEFQQENEEIVNNKVIEGKVKSINGKIIQILSQPDNELNTVEIKNDTKISKVYIDPETLQQKNLVISIDEIEIGSRLRVYSENEIKIIIENTLSGEIKSIDSNNITIETPNNIDDKMITKKISSSEKTKYFLLTYQLGENPSETKEIGLMDIVEGKGVIIYFTDDINLNPNQEAINVTQINEIKEE